jgi:hypothetical protein
VPKWSKKLGSGVPKWSKKLGSGVPKWSKKLGSGVPKWSNILHKKGVWSKCLEHGVLSKIMNIKENVLNPLSII